jgi:hypothetical protein
MDVEMSRYAALLVDEIICMLRDLKGFCYWWNNSAEDEQERIKDDIAALLERWFKNRSK